MKGLPSALYGIVFSFLTASIVAESEPLTYKHEERRCAIRGQCGKEGFFGGELPCPDNGLAQTPKPDTRERLVGICGAKWNEGEVCCDDAQVRKTPCALSMRIQSINGLSNNSQIDALSSNLDKAEQFIAACPACKENFYNLFCTFTCSPDQSLFVNVTSIGKSTSSKAIVTELDTLWSDAYGSAFYDSCKDVKFGAAGSTAMAFIGGGAKNYTQFLAFLGKKQPFLGSPFQINFPRPKGREKEGMEASDPVSRACNDEDPTYRCACVDCPASCPELPSLNEEESCHVGLLPCLSFSVILVYGVFLALLGGMIGGHVWYANHSKRKSERLQLLQDAAPSDDEDEGDIAPNAMLDHPQSHYGLNSVIDEFFSGLGSACAKFPLMTIGFSILLVGLLSIGWVRFEVEEDPVRLWVSPSSDTAQEKAFFDEHFGPFYRAEQAFVVNDTLASGPGPVLSWETLQWWADVEARAQRLMPEGSDITLNDVCFKPTGDACVTQSILGYFSKETSLAPNTWREQVKLCTDSPGEYDCLPDFQQPLDKSIILGGWDKSGDILDAQALITTWVVNNYEQGSPEEERAKTWEIAFQGLLRDVGQEAKDRGLRLSYNTEISLEEELNKSSNTDAKIVVISYIVMFFYVSFSLGSTSLSLRALLNNPSSAFVQSKFSLGVSGIVIVLMSISASVGLFSAAGIKVTLIIAEVIPFLVLAVGVDNIFLIVHEFERVNANHPDAEIHERMAKALGRMGPSILLSATSETVAFALGVLVGMPAVKNFAFYAAGAVVINALLQVTMFVSVLALNQRRVESNRVDCFPLIKLAPPEGTVRLGGAHNYNNADDEGPLQRFIRKLYAPALLGKKTKVGILVFFLGLFTAGIALLPSVELGLDQRIAIPDDSYLIPYFNDLYVYFDTGPPVYFVTRDTNLTATTNQRSVCARFGACHTSSLTNILEQESKRSNVSYISGATASWIDDFLYWLNPSFDCCTRADDGQPCFAGRDPPWNPSLAGMPEGTEFLSYAAQWLDAPTDESCLYGGKAAYSTAVVLDAERTTVPASHFRTMHTPLRSQADFIAAYASARRIANAVSVDQGVEIFPYSKFYVFFDQYTGIVTLASRLLGAALALILLIASALLGSLATGAIVTITVAMILIDILGVMALAHVSLNALSLVNLVICVGIGVEFCAHIARAFMFPSRSVLEKAKGKFRGRDARAWAALVNVGGSVFSGITVTKFLGVFVLAFTRSKVFEVYYFRIWLALVVVAALHALVFLPVALSLAGGEGEFFLRLLFLNYPWMFLE